MRDRTSDSELLSDKLSGDDSSKGLLDESVEADELELVELEFDSTEHPELDSTEDPEDPTSSAASTADGVLETAEL